MKKRLLDVVVCAFRIHHVNYFIDRQDRLAQRMSQPILTLLTKFKQQQQQQQQQRKVL